MKHLFICALIFGTLGHTATSFAHEQQISNMVMCRGLSENTLSITREIGSVFANSSYETLVAMEKRLSDREALLNELCAGLTTVYENSEPINALDILQITRQVIRNKISAIEGQAK